MANYPIITINGVNLVDAANRWGISPSQNLFRNIPGLRATSIIVPGRSGVVWPSFDPYETTKFSLDIRVFGDLNAATQDSRYASIVATLESLYFLLSQTPAEIMVQTSSSTASRRVAYGRLVSMTEPVFVNQDMAQLVAVYELPDVFWRGEGWGSSGVLGTLTTSHQDIELTPLQGSTGPITDAQFFISGPFTTCRISQLLPGGTFAGFTVTGPVASGKHIFVDTGAMIATQYDAVDWTGNGGGAVDFTTKVDSYGSGIFSNWLTLLPTVSSGDDFTDETKRKVKVGTICTGTTSTATKFYCNGRRVYF